jgi:hypothetical protein
VAEPSAKKTKTLQSEIEKYRKALAADPGSRLFAALADALRRAGDLKAAIDVATKGVARNPRYLSGLVVLGQALFEDSQLEKASELFQSVVKMNPENIIAQRALAEIYNHVGDHANALKTYRALTVLDPNDARAKQQLEILEATAPRTKPAEPSPEPGGARVPSPVQPLPSEPPESVVAPAQAQTAPPSEPDEDRTQEISAPPAPVPSPEAAEDSSTAVIPVLAAPQASPVPTGMPALPDDFFIPPEPSAAPPEPTAAPPGPRAAEPESPAPPESREPPVDPQEQTQPSLTDLPQPAPSVAVAPEPPPPAPEPSPPAPEPPPSGPPAEPSVAAEVSALAASTPELPLPADPQPSPIPAAPELKSEPAPVNAPTPAASAPPSPAKPLTEEEKLDLFFSGVSVPNGEAVRSQDRYVVKKAGDVFADQPQPIKTAPAPTAAKPAGPDEIDVTQSVLGRIYWRQGFHKKALAVMAEEIREHPEKKGLKLEFIQACLVLELNPAEVLIMAGAVGGPPGPARSERERVLADRFFEGRDGAAPDPESDPEPAPAEPSAPAAEAGPEPAREPPPEPAPASEPGSQPPGPEPAAPVSAEEQPKNRIDILRSYLKKIKRDKGEAQ